MMQGFIWSIPRVAAEKARETLLLPRRNASFQSSRWRAKLNVSVLNIGRHSSKDAVFDNVIAEYVKRLRPVMDLDMRWVKPEVAAANVLTAARGGASVICLDTNGRVPKCSEDFAQLLYDRLEAGGSRLLFVIGDAEGLPDELLEHASGRKATPKLELMSLSSLTLTHKMCRLFIAEQIYRATEIRRGSGYHK